MWSATTKKFGDRQTKYQILLHTQPVAYREILQAWQEDFQFRCYFIELLATSPFTAFRWETPPLTKDSGDRPFEFVLINSPDLDREPDVQTFRNYCDPKIPGGITEFPNLGNDAYMLVPCAAVAPDAYVHLAKFLRNAPTDQIHHLWQRVGAAMEHRLNTEPIWLNTAGGGVAWLHIRLDNRPKYYRYLPYKKPLQNQS